MQTGGRLIEHVKHARKTRTQLRRQTDTLRLTGRHGCGASVETEVPETHLLKERKAVANRLKQWPHGRFALLGDSDPCEPLREGAQVERAHLTDRPTIDANRARVLIEA